MSVKGWNWWLALGGSLWTWLLASWSGVSPLTSLLRAFTVFVMLAAALALFGAFLEARRANPHPQSQPTTNPPLSAPSEPEQNLKEAA